MATLSSRIKSLRQESGMTQTEFGRKFGVVKSTVSLYESGKSTPNDDIKLQMCSFFSVSMDYLLGLTDDRLNSKELEYRYAHVDNRLGNILEQYRRENNQQCLDFARLLGITEELETKIEAGIYIPSMKLIKKISEVTKYDVDYIIGAVDTTYISDKVKIAGTDLVISTVKSDAHFRSRLEELTFKYGVNNDNAEEKIGLGKQEFLDIQFNRMPTLSELIRISYALNVSMDYLIGKTDIPITNLSNDELELILNYRDCIEPYKKNIRTRAEKLSIESIGESIDAGSSTKNM